MNNTTLEAQEAFVAVAKRGTQHKNDDRVVKAIKVKQWVRQGDIQVERIPDSLEGLQLEETTERQLAPGTTKGSRHVAAGSVTVYNHKGRVSALTGPVIQANEPWNLLHPEHANINFPAGCYQVTYQQDREQEEIARVRD